MDQVPWLSFKDASQRLNVSRRTLDRLVDFGILVRVFSSIRAKGLTIESVANYEAGIQYKNQRERGLAETLPWSSKDQSPLHHVLVTGQYPAETKAGRSRTGASRPDPVSPLRDVPDGCARRGSSRVPRYRMA